MLRQLDDRVVLVAQQLELLDRKKRNTRLELANAIFEYLEIWHTRKRRHSQLGWRSPVEFERNRIITVA
jgi:transposase InsO family protein